ncbi:MAG: ActS/PrrB/RegB family redox-sensitive histidine kinase [Candidatus Symbiobacter sp.]|nr:ActS/PrrB/RegB family redox-sensitive histidine kinase [Candidatus Symbiobacter sp.]
MLPFLEKIAKALFHPMPHLPHFPHARAIRVGTMLTIRWLAVGGQFLTLMGVVGILHFQVPLVACLITIAISALFNLYMRIRWRGNDWLTEEEAGWQLGLDSMQLTLLLFFTGGLYNPFSLLLVVPVTMAAAILSLRRTVAMVFCILAMISFLAIWHFPLPWTPGGLELPNLYGFGEWAAMIFASLFMGFYAWRISSESRRMEAALTETHLALLSEQRISALGALAAAAAHELGSPLSTIAVVAGELLRDDKFDAAHQEDLKLLLSQTTRCREILAKLAHLPESAQDGLPSSSPVSAVIQQLHEQHDKSDPKISSLASPRPKIEFHVHRHPIDPLPEPHLPHRPEIIQGLGNLIQNALQFAKNRVIADISWSLRDLTIIIEDDGPGFHPTILSRLGEPYLSSRAGHDGHMGLGVFIATTLLRRSGASLKFANAPHGGAEIIICWPQQELG